MKRLRPHAGGRLVTLALGLVTLPLALAIASCAGDEITIPVTDEPFLYLVLGETTTVFYDPTEIQRGQHALLLTSGSAVETARFRFADVFRMHREGGDSAFAWAQNQVPYPDVGSFPHVADDEWNYYLPDDGSPLGAGDLRAGDTYELYIETEGDVVRGRVTIPGSFELTVDSEGGRRVAIWPNVPGAAGYRVHIGADRVRFQTDTVFVLGTNEADLVSVVVDALDPNAWGYATDPQAARAGIDGGFGLFGAITTASVAGVD